MKMTSLDLHKNKQFFIGILSGTSMDSISAIIINLAKPYKIITTIKYPYNKNLAKQILKIIETKQCSIKQLGLLDRDLAILFTKAINKLLQKAKISHKKIVAIGSHGQNIWHEAKKFSLQLADPSFIAAHTNITTVADFRRKDVALNGQGAPLAPLFHNALFNSRTVTRAVINIGGITNITVLPKQKNKNIIGFDIGPGNCLLDGWVQTKFKSCKINYDRDSHLAKQGVTIDSLLTNLLQDVYFKQKFPKSTGREYFNLAWLNKKIKNSKLITINKLNILRTLLQLTITIITKQIKLLNTKYNYDIKEIYLCGGGANNRYLLQLLQLELQPLLVTTTIKLGVHPDWVEAALFAWLAKQTLDKKTGNLPSVTGADKPAILGGVYH